MSAARPEKTPAALPHVLTVEMVLPSLDAGGQELVVSRLARQLAARGHDVGITLTIE